MRSAAWEAKRSLYTALAQRGVDLGSVEGHGDPMRGWDLFLCACALGVDVKAAPQDERVASSAPSSSGSNTAPDPGLDLIRKRMAAHERGETLRAEDVTRATTTEEAMSFMSALQG